MLIEHLQQMLRVVDRLPAGTPGNELRRGVCEAVEAHTASARRVRLERLLDEIARVPVPRAGTVSGGASAEGGLAAHLAALRAAILPLLGEPHGH